MESREADRSHFRRQSLERWAVGWVRLRLNRALNCTLLPSIRDCPSPCTVVAEDKGQGGGLCAGGTATDAIGAGFAVVSANAIYSHIQLRFCANSFLSQDESVFIEHD